MRKKRYGDLCWSRCKLSRILRVMKMVFFMMLISLTHLSAKVNSQNKVINLTLKNVSVEQAISKAERQLQQSFFFNREKVDLQRRLDIDLSDAGLDELVQQLFGDQFKYRLVDDIIVISQKDETLPQVKEVRITGTVKDKKGNLLPGVTVLVKGTQVGVATDIDGRF